MLSHFGTAGSVDQVCPGPQHPARPPARFVLPRGAVDAHAHVIGPPPYNPARSYTPPEQPKARYFEMLDAVGFDYGVLIQTSVHGTDNAVLLDALRSRPERLRGVAVVSPDASPAQLAALKEAGVRGLRLITAASGGIGLRDLADYEAICREFGFHIQIMFDASQLGDDVHRLAALKVPLVIDHLGYFPASEGVASAAMAAMRALLSEGAWVKLSGGFRLAASAEASIPIVQACFEAAPDRSVWGSDWPHVGFWGPMPHVGDLLDLLDRALGPADRDRVLKDNAHALYGFA
jgi:predicted TIM-barrel fold metal-dependent hydrolase